MVVGAPLTSVLGARLPRRRYLAALIAWFGVMNLAAAALPGLAALTATRFLAGLPHGGFLGVAMLMAADAMPPEKRARGTAQILLGLTVANIAGVPLAGAMGQGIGWRWGFALPGVLGLLTALLILRLAPRGQGNAGARPLGELAALRNPAVLLTLAVGAIGFGGMFAVYSYLSAAMLATGSPPSWAVPVALSNVTRTPTPAETCATSSRVPPGRPMICIGPAGFFPMSEAFALARGYGGQVVCIVPGRGLTVVITSDPTQPARSEGYFGDLMALIDGTLLAEAA